LLDGKVSAKPDNGAHPDQGTGCCQGDGGVGDCECLKLYHILHLFQIYMVNFKQFAIIFIVGQRHFQVQLVNVLLVSIVDLF
jgi:hypothetical protein